MTADYHGDLADVRKIETSSAQLYRYAQDKKLAPVFPAGLILQASQSEIRAQLYLEIMEKDTQDPHTMILPEGTFLCSKLDMTPDMDLPAAIHHIYEDVPYTRVIVANILLDKFQIGTRRSEVQMRIL